MPNRIHTVSATQASRTLSDILNKVHYQGQSFEIKRGKEIIAKIIPYSPRHESLKAKDLNDLFKRLPSLDAEDAKRFEQDIRGIRKRKRIERNKWD